MGERRPRLNAHGTGGKFLEADANIQWMDGEVQLSFVVPHKAVSKIRISPVSARGLAVLLVEWADYEGGNGAPRPPTTNLGDTNNGSK